MQSSNLLAQRLCWLIASAFIFSLALLHHLHVSTQTSQDLYLEAAEWPTQGPSGDTSRWFRRRGESLELVTRIGKNHETVHDSFEDVVQEVNDSTVRIMSGSRQVSLGVVVRADGMILTKATELPEKFECRLPSGVVAEGSVLGTDLDFDLALVKIANDKLQPVTWLEAAAPTVGSWVATPSGFTSTPVAIGVVSVAERRIRTEPAVLGIQLEDTADGPRVIQVMENSGAEKAGIDVDDVILRINNQQVGTFANLRSLVRNHRPGEKLKVEVKRGEESLSKTVELTQQSEVMPDDEAIQNSIGGELSRRRTGFPGALQHDTVLAPNQCGGPLVNLEGQVIGINIARAGRVATYAASSRTIKPRVETLLKQADARQ